MTKLCIPDHKAVWSTVPESWLCFISWTGDGWDSRSGAGMGCWFVSGFLWRISSCVIRPGSDPTCPDVPPHPPSCPCVTHTLMNRRSRATSELAWPAVWLSEDSPQLPPLQERPGDTVHYSLPSTFIRALFKLPLIYCWPVATQAVQ